jgi:hypothetical protein
VGARSWRAMWWRCARVFARAGRRWNDGFSSHCDFPCCILFSQFIGCLFSLGHCLRQIAF